MYQLTTTPGLAWVWWLAAITLFVSGILLMRKSSRTEPPHWLYFYVSFLLVCMGIISFAVGNGVRRNSIGVRLSIQGDPALSKMAKVAEALDWMEKEVEPLVADLIVECDKLESTERGERETALAKVKEIGAKLEAKKREFDLLFGKLGATDDSEEQPSANVQKSEFPVYVSEPKY